MYAEDLADFIHYSLINYDLLESYTNVGIGNDYSILDYYKEIASVVKYNGDFEFDVTKPSGMKRKLCSIEKQNKLDWKPKHNLREGLTKTYKFYLEIMKYKLATSTWDQSEIDAINNVVKTGHFSMGSKS